MTKSYFELLQVIFCTSEIRKDNEVFADLNRHYEAHRKAIKDYSIDNDGFIDLIETKYYSVIGHYDVAAISYIESNKVAQSNIWNIKMPSTNYQVLVGMLLYTNNSFKPSGNENLIITSIKINNALLIGNGSLLLDDIVSFYKNNLSEFDFIICQSLNWFELLIIIKINDIKRIPEITKVIRNVSSDDLDHKEDIIANCLIKKGTLGPFAAIKETQSTFLFPYLGEMKEILPHLFFKVEVKPGHDKEFINGIISKYRVMMELGKFDFKILSSISNIYTEDFSIINYLRKIKSSISLEYVMGESSFEENINSNLNLNNKIYNVFEESNNDSYRVIQKSNLGELLKKKLISINDFGEIDYLKLENALKQHRLSRHIRKKVIKLFILYNNQIVSPINSIYFIDLYDLLKYFHDTILNFDFLKDLNRTQNYFSISKINNYLSSIMAPLNDAYMNRALNGYSLESLHELNVDFNSSIPQVITTYDTITKLINYVINGDYNIVLNSNEENSMSNAFTVKYNIIHLTNPAYFSCTILKEILNNYFKKEIHDNHVNELGEKYLLFIKEHNLDVFYNFDISYFLNDVCRYSLLFATNNVSDIELFLFWLFIIELEETNNYDIAWDMREECQARGILRGFLIFAVHFKFYESQYNGSIYSEYIELLKRIGFDNEIYKKNIEDKLLLFSKFWNEFENEILVYVIQKADTLLKGSLKRLKIIDDNYPSTVAIEFLIRELNISKTESEYLEFRKIALETLKFQFEKSNKKINLLNRSISKSEISLFIKDQPSSYYIDKASDYFINSLELQLQQTTQDNVTYKKYWNLGMKYKRKLFNI